MSAIRKSAYTPFTSKELKPKGWLRRQLEIQAEGLSGNLDKVWRDIRDSKWIGGDAEGWERVPYWLDGFIPLAYLLEDADMIARAKKYIDAILDRQRPDGWICPCEDNERAHYDVWAALLISKVLVLYADCSGDDRIEDAVRRLLKNLQNHIRGNTLFNWGAARYFEGFIAILWLYERTGEDWLISLAQSLTVQGTDWGRLFRNWRDMLPRREWSYQTHVVNIAMALKAGALEYRLGFASDPDEQARDMLRKLFTHHGTAAGHFTGDECLSGTNPTQGTELCGVAEAMYSYETLLAVSGAPEWGDRLEALAFNAYPATVSSDMWTHQYDQLTNQIECSRIKGDVIFRTNGPESHLFGLEPNFGCCTANFSQAFPKLALSAMMRHDDGLFCALLLPCELNCRIGGADVRCSVDTLYPFRDSAVVTVSTGTPVEFSLKIRIPEHAGETALSVKTPAGVEKIAAAPGTVCEIRRVFDGVTEIAVEMSPEFALIPRPNGMYTLRRGALLYSVAIDEEWVKHEYERNGVDRTFPYCDYEIFPKSNWEYAFAGDMDKITPVLFENTPGEILFDPKNPPVYAEATLVPVNWGRDETYPGFCAVTPASAKAAGDPVRVQMIPYGATNLRMTEMPMGEV